MIHFTTYDPEISNFDSDFFCGFDFILLIVNTQVGIVSATVSNTTQTGIPVYEITTRGNLFNAQGVNGPGYRDTYPLFRYQKFE